MLFKELIRIQKQGRSNSEALTKDYTLSNIKSSFLLELTEEETDEAIQNFQNHPLGQINLCMGLFVLQTTGVVKEMCPDTDLHDISPSSIIKLIQTVNENQLTFDMQTQIYALRYNFRECYRITQFSPIWVNMFEQTCDIWMNIASGGIVYKDNYICCVYKAEKKTQHPGKSELKIAVKSSLGTYSYSETDLVVPLSSYKQLKVAIQKLKKNPKFSKIKGHLTSNSAIKLAKLVGLIVIGNYAYIYAPPNLKSAV